MVDETTPEGQLPGQTAPEAAAPAESAQPAVPPQAAIGGEPSGEAGPFHTIPLMDKLAEDLKGGGQAPDEIPAKDAAAVAKGVSGLLNQDATGEQVAVKPLGRGDAGAPATIPMVDKLAESLGGSAPDTGAKPGGGTSEGSGTPPAGV